MILRSAGLRQSQFNHRYCRQILTAGSVFRGPCAAGRGFGRACNVATTFHVLYRPQVANFSLLNSAPNGVNYMDIRSLFLHRGFRLPD
jgi:hypothetical protein